MSKKVLFSCVMIVLMSIVICGKSYAKKTADKSKWVKINLSVEGVNLLMTVPEGAKAVSTSYSFTVQKGENFQIEIHNSKADLQEIKKELKANTVNKLKTIAVDSPVALLYSSDTGFGEEWHFIAAMKIGDTDYYCEDVKGATYKKEDAEIMLKAAQSLAKK